MKRGLDDAGTDVGQKRVRHDRCRCVSAHAARVRTGITFSNAFVVLGSGQQNVVGAIDECEDARFLASHELLDHHVIPGRAERRGVKEFVEGTVRLGQGSADDGALARSQAAGLHDHGCAGGFQVRVGGVRLIPCKRPVFRRRDSVTCHEVFRERLATLETSRGSGGTNDRKSCRLELVGYSVYEGQLGSDDRQIDQLLLRESQQSVDVCCVNRNICAEFEGSGVARGNEYLGTCGTSTESPDERMLSASSTDYQYSHVLNCSIRDDVPRRYDRVVCRPAAAGRRTFRYAVLLLSLLISLGTETAFGQSDERSFVSGIKFYPGSLWSSTMGIGIGLGYEFEGITGSTSSLLLVAKPSIHRGIYEASYVTRDPYGGTPYLGAAVYYEDTGRTRYYGIGPFTSGDARVFVKDHFLRVRLRGGVPLGDTRWVVQPVGEFVTVKTDTFRNDDRGAFEAMQGASREALLRAVSSDGIRQWMAGGVEAGLYFGGEPPRTGSAFQVALARFQSISSDDQGFWRAGAMVVLDEPIGSRRIFGRVAFATIFGEQADVPYYLLPRLGGRLLPGIARYRFRGNSVVAASAGFEQPLLSIYDYAGVDLVAMAGVGSVYDDFSDQFTARVSFEETFEAGGRAPLRPAAAAGFRFYVGERPLEITVVGGISAERMSVVTFRVHRDMRHRQGFLFR